MISIRTNSGKVSFFGNPALYCAALAGIVAVLCFTLNAEAQIYPVMDCDMEEDGIGSVVLEADRSPVTILAATEETAGGGVPYCLVKVLVPEAINIWVGLPMDGQWNGRLQSLGGGVYCGSVSPPTSPVSQGYVGITTDTGHSGSFLDGSFAMEAPGVPNYDLQIDFSYRSIHLMAVIGKQLIEHFYGENKLAYSYWNGCSTGGRQGLAMAQRYPEDYDGILAGAPAIHFDRFQAAHMWPPVVQNLEGYVPIDKKILATAAAIAACDGSDGVIDGILRDPRQCTFDARELICQEGQDPDTDSCLTEAEASAINKIWYGPTNEKGNKRLWYGLTRGTDLTALAGGDPTSPFFSLFYPFPVAIQQPRYWVYYDPDWDWHYLDYSNYEDFFEDTVDAMAASGTATDNPNLAPFRDHGGKLIMWHGFNDQLIFPEGTIDYYDRVLRALGGGYKHTQEFARLFMAPGVAHCSGGPGPEPPNWFDYLVDWVEEGVAPDTILAEKGAVTRPLCPYPEVAGWDGEGDIEKAESFRCVPPTEVRIKPEVLNLKRKGKFTAFITVPGDYRIKDWNLQEITCEGAPAIFGRAHKNVYIAKFYTQDMQDVAPGESVTLTVRGKFYKDGVTALVQASDTVSVIDHKKCPTRWKKWKK